MRTLKLAIYILAALATCDLSHEAKATSKFKSVKEPQISNAAALNKTEHSLYQGKTLVALEGRASDLLAQATTLSDIQGNWAQSFIEALAAQNVIRGFPDGSFRPDQPVTRAEFAAMISKAFQKNPIRAETTFVDVPANNWAMSAIQSAYQMGFLVGYPNNVFMPNQNVPRDQVLVALGNGLNLSAKAEHRDDGGVVFGFGLGNDRKLVGLEVAVSSYSTVRQGFLNNGGISLKLHRSLSDNTAIAFGIENVGSWGRPDAGDNSVYGVVSQIFRLREDPSAPFSKLIVSVGVGGGRFRSESHGVTIRLESLLNQVHST